MSVLGAHLGLAILVLCLVAAAVLVVLGALRVVRAGSHLRTRLDGYADLPLREDAARAEMRIARAERTAATVPALTRRARAAMLEIQAARARLGLALETVKTALRFARSLLSP